MGKNNPVRNSFYFFMLDFRNQSSIQFANMKEVADAAGPRWKELTPGQREPYELRAKAEKKQRVKYTTLGENIAQRQRQEKELEAKVQEMKGDIANTVLGAIKAGHIAEHPFYFIHVNHYGFYSSDRHFIPAELSVVRFTLKDGVTPANVYHSIIKPGPLPLGYAFQAVKVANDTHQIQPTLGDDAESNLIQVRKEFMSFMKKCSYRGKIPPVYVNEKNREAVESVLKSFCLSSGYNEDFIKVYWLEYFYFVLRNSVGNPKKPVYPSVAAGQLELEKDKFDFCNHIPCSFHADSDVLNHCSRSHAVRTAYIVCDNCCSDVGIDLIAGQHVPLDSKIVSRPPSSASSCPTLNCSAIKQRNGRRTYRLNPTSDDYFLSQKTESGMSEMSQTSNVCTAYENAVFSGYDSEYQTDGEEFRNLKQNCPASPCRSPTDLHFMYSSDDSSRKPVNRRPTKPSAAFLNGWSQSPVSPSLLPGPSTASSIEASLSDFAKLSVSPQPGPCPSFAASVGGIGQLRLSPPPGQHTSAHIVAVGRGRGRAHVV